MGLQGPFIDKRRGDTIPTAYYVCTSASHVDFKNGVIVPMFSVYYSRDQYKNNGEALLENVSAPSLFGSNTPDPVIMGSRFSIDKKKPDLEQIYTEVKKMPKAAGFQDVLEEGQGAK